MLKGLQHIWCDEALRARLFVKLDEHILPEADRQSGVRGWTCGRFWYWARAEAGDWAATSTVFTT